MTCYTGAEVSVARMKPLMVADLIARMKPSMLAELYWDLEETAETQEGAALVKTQRLASLVHAELVTSIGAEEARERIEGARANT